jgi:hypothetical protein
VTHDDEILEFGVRMYLLEVFPSTDLLAPCIKELYYPLNDWIVTMCDRANVNGSALPQIEDK